LSVRLSHLAEATHLRPEDVLSTLHQLGMITSVEGQHAVCIRNAAHAAGGGKPDSGAREQVKSGAGGQQDSEGGKSSAQLGPPAEQQQVGGSSSDFTECELNGAALLEKTEPAADAPQWEAAAAGDVSIIPRIVFERSRLHFTPYHLRPEVKRSAAGR
jgi:hypothetical protein